MNVCVCVCWTLCPLFLNHLFIWYRSSAGRLDQSQTKVTLLPCNWLDWSCLLRDSLPKGTTEKHTYGSLELPATVKLWLPPSVSRLLNKEFQPSASFYTLLFTVAFLLEKHTHFLRLDHFFCTCLCLLLFAFCFLSSSNISLPNFVDTKWIRQQMSANIMVVRFKFGLHQFNSGGYKKSPYLTRGAGTC